MATTAELLEELSIQKVALAENLATKGVDALASEGFTTLVPKVLEIQAGGGENGAISSEDSKSFFAQLFKILSTGEYETGEFTLDANLPAGENVIFETNLGHVFNGIFIYGTNLSEYVVDTSSPEAIAWAYALIGDYDETNGYYNCSDGAAKYTCSWGDASNSLGINKVITSDKLVTRGTSDIVSSPGSLIVTPTWGGNANYTPFLAGIRYAYIVW